MAIETRHRSMLRILLATAERALEAFEAADNPADEEFVHDLRRIVERTRAELGALDGTGAATPQAEDGANGRA